MLNQPIIPTGATKGEIRGIAIGVVVLCLIFAAFTGTVELFFRSITDAQINIAMPLMVQLDSFLTGGWVVGFFYYWSSWERALRASKFARRRLKEEMKDAVRVKREQLTTLANQMEKREKELSPTQGLFVALILGVMMFIISGITAVFAVLTYALIMVRLALEFLVGGVLVMGFSWVALRYVTQRLREAIDVALESME